MFPLVHLTIQILKIHHPIDSLMVSIIYSTTDTNETAKTIAHVLVKEKLVACVHILPRIESVYRWQGKVEEANECVLLAKTSERNVQKAIQKIRSLHPYEVPEILVFPPVGGLKEYLDYVDEETL
jgi:periplasmic divalent cation tolerance protein